ncbi:MAG TPA: DNA cytosine methyltransferase [Candidatus Binatia bacterium]|nr:DNA cytosine methyltransferase [Candidatus Binatia bacterium]
MRHLDLFTGIGGFTIAAESVGFETVAFSEIHKDKCIVLKHYWPHVPNLGDICDEHFLERARAIEPFDLVTGGVPCQPASALGQMRGASDERWLWPEFVRVVRTFRPRVAVAENPPSVLVLPEFHGVLGEIAALGYDLLWDVIPAAAFGAGHLRERVFIVAADARRCRRQTRTGLCTVEPTGEKRRRSGDPDGETSANSNGQRRSEEGRRLSIRETDRKGQMESLRQSSEINREAVASNTDHPRLQGHAGDAVRDEGQKQERSVAETGIQDAVADAEYLGSQNRIQRRDKQAGAETQDAWLHGNETVGESHHREATLPDLRGRVTGPDWWHEAHTGIPVLAPGIPGRLAEAVSLCVGDSVVPQVAAAVLQPIYEMLKR